MYFSWSDPYIVSTLVVGVVSFLVAAYWWRLRKYPPGPLPLPILGNILMIRSSLKLYEDFQAWSRKYGDPFTVWLFNRPCVIINDPKNVAECHAGDKRYHFSSRPPTNMAKLFVGGGDDVFFNSVDPAWNTLRKVTIQAIRKYAVSEHLRHLVADVTDLEIDDAVAAGKPVLVNRPLEDIIVNVMAIAAFGFRLDRDDPDRIKFRKVYDDMQVLNQAGLPSDLSPILRFLYFRRERLIRRTIKQFRSFAVEYYKKAKESYDPSEVRHFTDAIQAARDEAIRQESASAQHLTDTNMCNIVVSLFNAGIQGSTFALRWSLLILAKYPEIQEQLREEVTNNIGDRVASFSDREKLPLVSSFLMESLRAYPLAALLAFHSTQCDTELNGRKIPRDTMIMINSWAQMQNPAYWKNPTQFKADRFVENGKFVPRNQPEYAAFGVGPRACPGEKLALAEMFLVFVRILQKSRIVAPDGCDAIDLAPNEAVSMGCQAKKQMVKFERLN